MHSYPQLLSEKVLLRTQSTALVQSRNLLEIHLKGTKLFLVHYMLVLQRTSLPLLSSKRGSAAIKAIGECVSLHDGGIVFPSMGDVSGPTSFTDCSVSPILESSTSSTVF